eukprot:312195-Pyramimonas_sp.AAC.1
MREGAEEEEEDGGGALGFWRRRRGRSSKRRKERGRRTSETRGPRMKAVVSVAPTPRPSAAAAMADVRSFSLSDDEVWPEWLLSPFWTRPLTSESTHGRRFMWKKACGAGRTFTRPPRCSVLGSRME